MCYSLYLSTTSTRDHGSEWSGIHFIFQPVAATGEEVEKCASLLQHDHRWLVGAEGGCSCGFRHLMPGSQDPGFSEPEDWYPEDHEEIEATKALYGQLRLLLEAGEKVDLVDAWEGADPAGVESMQVDLAVVGATEFRLFENRRFELRLTR